MSDSWATIISAIIGALATIIVTKFDAIKNMFSRKELDISGEWDIISYEVDSKKEKQWLGQYIINIKQSGNKIDGQMIATKVREGHSPYKYKWNGSVRGSYLNGKRT